jgi:DHA2 family multidrug resistance protein
VAFMVVLFTFIVIGAIGVPAHEYARGFLGGTPYQSIWYMNAYLIPCALMLTLVGNLRQRYGGRTLAIIGPAIFSLSLIGAALTQESLLFILLRIIQGLSSAVCAAVGGGWLNGGIGSKHSQLGKGLFILVFAFGATAGIAISACTTWYLSWRIVYAFFGICLGVAWLLIYRYLPKTPSDPSVTIDWLTFTLICSGFGLFSLSLAWGNQHEWFQSPFYCIQLSLSLISIILFFVRLSSAPPLLNPKVFQDINFCISTANLTLILFAVFLVFNIVPTFMIKVVGNTVGTYAGPFSCFSLACVATTFLFAPGINPHAIGSNITQRKISSNIGVFGFGLTALWMAQTNAMQSNNNLTIQLILLGISFGLILNELLMCFATMPAELTTTASAVNFFGTNIAKSLSGGLSGAISTASSQGSWERFRMEVGVSQEAIADFQLPLQNHLQQGIEGGSWSQASLEIINHAISQQAEVITYINTATLTGWLLLAFGLLPFLHRDEKAFKEDRKN